MQSHPIPWSITIILPNCGILKALFGASPHTSSATAKEDCEHWLTCKEYHGPLLTGLCQIKSRPRKTSSTMDWCKARAYCRTSWVKIWIMNPVENSLVTDSDVAYCSQMRPDCSGGGCSVSQYHQNDISILLQISYSWTPGHCGFFHSSDVDKTTEWMTGGRLAISRIGIWSWNQTKARHVSITMSSSPRLC